MILCVMVLLMLLCCRGQGFPVAITELMPDPSPSLGLPAEEFVEVWNNSSDTINLGGWVLTNGRSRAKFPAGSQLLPDSLLLLCKLSVADAFAVYGRVLGLSGFPALSNEGDTVWLENAHGIVVHAVGYNARSYGGVAVDGRSLELADRAQPCRLLGNWRPSTDSSGGNPGVLRQRITENRPAVSVYAFAENESWVQLVFNERAARAPLLSIKAAAAGGPPGSALTVDSMAPLGIMHNAWRLYLHEPLQPGTVYTLSVQQFFVCDTVYTGMVTNCMLPDTSFAGLVLNEILFDPPPEGADYIELFNNGVYAIPLASLLLGNRDKQGKPAGLRALAVDGRCILPGEWLAFSTDTAWVRQRYGAGNLVELPSMASYPNESGAVLLARSDGALIEAVDYEVGWHHPLVRDPESVALERIDPSAAGNLSGNWTSSAMHTRYGTPGRPNSQGAGAVPAAAEAKFFQTEMGFREIILHYRFPERGYALSVTVYDFSGREIRQLVRNGICALEGRFTWNGHAENGRVLPPGPYVLVAEAFNLSGKTLRVRRAVGINW